MGNLMNIKLGKEETYLLLVIAMDTKIPIYSLLHIYHLSRQLNKAFCALTNVCDGVVRVQTWSDLPRHSIWIIVGISGHTNKHNVKKVFTKSKNKVNILFIGITGSFVGDLVTRINSVKCCCTANVQ